MKELLKHLWYNDQTGGLAGMVFFFAIGGGPFFVWWLLS